MNRNIMLDLVAWKEEGSQKVLLLCGIKGTGKTYLAIDFAKNNYSQYLYLNFELNQHAREFFGKGILAGKTIRELLAEFFQLDTEYLSELLLIVDEVSFCPSFYMALEHYKDSPVLAISGILPGNEMKEYFTVIKVYPLGFDEFLSAVGNDWYRDIIRGHYLTEQPIPDIVHQELLALFEEYLMVGGMPASINEYLASNTTENVGEVLLGVRNRMESSLEGILEPGDLSKAIQVLRVVPEQLQRENKKFRFNLIRKGVTYALYQDAITALEKSGVVLKLDQIEKENHFKLYLPDVGMLSAAFQGQMNEEIRKGLLENYIMQTLHRSERLKMAFWESDAQAKVDFLLCDDEGTTPVELRISSNSKNKSIGVYYMSHPHKEEEKYIRLGFENYYSTPVLRHVPIYALFCLV